MSVPTVRRPMYWINGHYPMAVPYRRRVAVFSGEAGSASMGRVRGRGWSRLRGRPGLPVPAGVACGSFPGRLPSPVASVRGVSAGSADLVEQPEVVAQSGEEEFAGDGGQAAQGEAAKPDAVFEAGVRSFDVGGAALVQG